VSAERLSAVDGPVRSVTPSTASPSPTSPGLELAESVELAEPAAVTEPSELTELTAPSDDVGATPPGQRRRRGPRWALRPLVIYLASRVVTVGTLAVTGIITHRSIPTEVDRWDSRWFLRAAANGWPSSLPHHHGHVAGNTVAFFPLFPLTIRWLSHLTGLSLLASGMIISEVTGLTAMIGVWKLVRHYADQSAADRATLLVAVFPGTFVLSLVYSEGWAITFLSFGILALLQRRWVVAGVLGLLATATTPVALAFELSCLWCAYRAVHDDRDWRSLVAPILTPVGFASYQVWLWWHTGNPAAWRVTERGGWRSYPSLLYPVHIVVSFLRDPVANTETTDLLFVGTVVTVIGAVIAIRSRMPKAALLYGLGAAFLGLVSAPIGLRPRFILLAFPLIIAVGIRLKGRSYLALVAVSVVLLAVATAYSICSFKVFP
jgi:hypothetical protein